MSEHQIDPDEYLEYVHQINYDVVLPNEEASKNYKKFKW